MCMFCRSLFVLLYFFLSLCCLFFFDIRILITPLVSSHSSYRQLYKAQEYILFWGFFFVNILAVEFNFDLMCFLMICLMKYIWKRILEINFITWNVRRVWRYHKVTIRIRKSKKNRQHNGQKINLTITTSS